jgi:hypothetical protein
MAILTEISRISKICFVLQVVLGIAATCLKVLNGQGHFIFGIHVPIFWGILEQDLGAQMLLRRMIGVVAWALLIDLFVQAVTACINVFQQKCRSEVISMELLRLAGNIVIVAFIYIALARPNE